jgi:flagellar L-ring protein precursor FlgH
MYLHKIGLIIMMGIFLVFTGAASGKSLWSDDSPINTMLTGANASKVGEILTIIIQEDNRANDTADGEAVRRQTFDGVFSTIFNNRFMSKVFGGSGNENAPAFKWNSTNDWRGETEVARESSFNSRVAATIVRIDEVGNYLIEARKTIRVGRENKSIILSGKVRPRDISQENTIVSYQVADAEISYLGEGTITRLSNPSIFQSFLNFLF